MSEDDEEDDADVITFHDALNNDMSAALSDEEDVSIEYFELDEELDDRQHRKSDIIPDEYQSTTPDLKSLKMFGSQILSKVFKLKNI